VRSGRLRNDAGAGCLADEPDRFNEESCRLGLLVSSPSNDVNGWKLRPLPSAVARETPRPGTWRPASPGSMPSIEAIPPSKMDRSTPDRAASAAIPCRKLPYPAGYGTPVKDVTCRRRPRSLPPSSPPGRASASGRLR
jgi:hypothetical protein